MQTFKELKEFLSADISHWKPYGWGGLFSVCCRFVVIFRISSWLKNKKGLFYKLIYILFWVIYKHYQVKTGIQLPIGTLVGKGLFFPHFSCIIINRGSIIGDWCTIYQGVTIGRSHDGKVPTIGDRCCIYAGAKVIGGINLGNGSVIGANAVVTKDVSENDIVVGVPAKSVK